MDYKILEVHIVGHIFSDRRNLYSKQVTVAIESSIGKFKAYQEHFDNPIDHDTLIEVAKRGKKLGKEAASKLLPLCSKSMKYEG